VALPIDRWVFATGGDTEDDRDEPGELAGDGDAGDRCGLLADDETGEEGLLCVSGCVGASMTSISASVLIRDRFTSGDLMMVKVYLLMRR
jgi:hypothetical protein